MSRVIPTLLGESRVIRQHTNEDRGADMLALSAREAAVAAQIESRARSLAVDIAARILRVRASDDEQLIARVAEDAVERLPRTHAATLRVHPLDRAATEAFLAARALTANIADDANLERGGCIVESAAGRVDARLETQLAAFSRVLGVTPRGKAP